MRTFVAFFIFSLFLSIHFLHSQNVVWSKIYGGSLVERGNSIANAPGGGYVVAGQAESTNGDVIGNRGSSDAWVIRLDSIGDTLWTKSLGGTDSDKSYSIQSTQDGGFILAAGSFSDDVDVPNNKGSSDFWIVKLDGNGDIAWSRVYGGSNLETPYSILQTTDLGYIVAGNTSSTNGDVHGNHGGFDFWVLKLDAAGDTLWTRTYGGSDSERAFSIQQTADGGYIIGGETDSSDGDVSGTNGDRDYWLVRTDAVGDTLWTKAFGGSNPDYLTVVRETADGGFLALGNTSSSDGDVSGFHGSRDCWVVRMDSLGDTLWTNSIGGSNTDLAESFVINADGDFVFSGSSLSDDGDIPPPNQSRDAWIGKISAGGQLLWSYLYGGTDQEYFQSIIVTTDGGYASLGYSRSDDGDVPRNPGEDDFWILKVDDPSVSVEDPFLSSITVFPNPVREKLIIQFAPPTHAANFEFKLFDVTGREYKGAKVELYPSYAVVNLSTFPSGIYQLLILSDDQIIGRKKIMKVGF